MLRALIFATLAALGVGDACGCSGMGGPLPSLASVAVAPESSKNEARHRRDLEADAALGKSLSEQVAKEMKLSQDEAMIARVRRIGADLAEIANAKLVKVLWGDSRLNPFTYTFNVLQGPDINAFSLPGGYIYVYEGLLNYAESDDELAGVLAHEIAHASFRHIATLRREQDKLTAITLPLILIAILTGGESGANVAQAGILTNTAIGSGWSQKAEESADYGAVQYLVESRYNPLGVLTFMERLAYDDRNKPNVDWGIYRTHPPSRERANDLLRALRDRNVPIARSLVTTTLRTKAELTTAGWTLTYAKVKIATFRGEGAEARAKANAKLLDAFFDETPKLSQAMQGVPGTVLGDGRPILRLEPSDVPQDETLEGVGKAALAAIKRALYELAYRTWDSP